VWKRRNQCGRRILVDGGVSAAVQAEVPEVQLVQYLLRSDSSMAAIRPWNHHPKDANKPGSEENEVRDAYVCVPVSVGAALHQADGGCCRKSS